MDTAVRAVLDAFGSLTSEQLSSYLDELKCKEKGDQTKPMHVDSTSPSQSEVKEIPQTENDMDVDTMAGIVIFTKQANCGIAQRRLSSGSDPMDLDFTSSCQIEKRERHTSHDSDVSVDTVIACIIAFTK
jgi:hypothetical protein